MRSSYERSDNRARVMLDIIAKVVSSVTNVTVDELRSSACAHRITQARFIFVDLCNGVVSPMPLVAEYLSKNQSMISYYKKSHYDYYTTYKDFRRLSDKSDELLTELLTKINGTFGNVFQEEGEQVQC
jgi:hypothetical protein